MQCPYVDSLVKALWHGLVNKLRSRPSSAAGMLTIDPAIEARNVPRDTKRGTCFLDSTLSLII